MGQKLDQLSDALFEKTSVGFSQNQKLLLQARWARIRDVASQNAGYRSWGDHLLRLKADEFTALQAAFKESVRSIEGEALDLAHAFVEIHPDLFGLHFLLDQNVRLRDLALNKASANAILLDYDPSIVAQHRACFQEIFKVLSTMEMWPRRDMMIAQMLVGNLIALLPYFDFEDGATLSILRQVEGHWSLVEYRVQYLPLVQDKIIAYGLEPLEGLKTAPLLIFRGTPYPAASGFFEAVWSDLQPTKSIGQDIFQKGKPTIDRWMEGKAKVECYGMSLGGALAYHAGHAYGEKIEVHAYGAPGLVPMKGGLSQIRGQVFFHLNDLVKLVGFHPESEHFEIFAVLTATDPDFIRAHARPSGIEPTLVLKINPRHENRTGLRYFFNFLKIIVSTVLFLILLPIYLCLKTGEIVQKLWKRVSA